MNKVDLEFLQSYSRVTSYTIPKWVFLSKIAKTLAKNLSYCNYSLSLSSVNIVVDSCFCKINLYAPKFQLTIIELTLD